MRIIFPNTHEAQLTNGGSTSPSFLYAPLFNGSQVNSWAEDLNATYVIPAAGTMSNLRFRTDSTVGGTSPSYTFTIAKNDVAQGESVTLSSGEQDEEDTSNVVSLVSGDFVHLIHSESGTPDNEHVSWSVRWDGNNPNEAFTTNCWAQPSTLVATPGTTQSFDHIFSPTGWSTTESDHYFYCPMGGTIKSFYVFLERTFTDTGTFDFSIYKNGVQQASSVINIDNTHTLKQVHSVTGLDISFSAGDTLTFGGIQNGSVTWPTAGSGPLSAGFMYEPTNPGEFMVGGYNGVDLPQNEVNYMQLTNCRARSTTENNFKALIGEGLMVKSFTVNLSTAPGVGKDRVFRIRKNGANGDGVVTISGTDTSGTDGTNVDTFSSGDFLNISAVTDDAGVASATAFYSAVLKSVSISQRVMMF